MVFQCLNCGGDVGEESCVGCRIVVKYYMCSNCQKPTMNPRYRSGVECPSCKKQVFEHDQKAMRHLIKNYLCQYCEAVVPNTKYTNDASCANCNRFCDVCHGYVACSDHLKKCVCVDCGKDITYND